MPNEKVINTPRDPYQTTTTGSDQRFRSQQPNIGNTLAQDLALIPNLDPEISRLIKGYLPFITLHEVNIIGGPVGKPPNFRPDLVIHNPKDPEKIQKKLMRLQSYMQLSLAPYHLYPMILEPYLQGRYIGYMEDAKKSPANGQEYSYIDILIAFVKGVSIGSR